MSLNCWHIPTSEEEIVDVFVEEVNSLLKNIDLHMQAWVKHPGDKKTLTEIRRDFHTLKGSGRLVKALDLSEMAWKVENMLNQAIAGVVPVSDPMVKLVAAVRAQVPRMVDAFSNRRSTSGNNDILRLMKLADTLATERKPARVSTPPAVGSAAIGIKQSYNPSELHIKLERCMQRADEALHRSEMALQRARRIAAMNGGSSGEVKQQACCGEAERIGERVNRLAKEVSELRIVSQNSQIEPILQQSEMTQIVEKEMQAKLMPMELLRVELTKDMEENRRALTALQRFGWPTFILSALAGGMVAAGLLVSILSLA